jgi:prepilin-type N-terminal cleavage/methylation domain-containing protein
MHFVNSSRLWVPYMSKMQSVVNIPAPPAILRSDVKLLDPMLNFSRKQSSNKFHKQSGTNNSTSAFTLIEMLLSISLFSIVIVITAAIFIDSLRLDRKTSLQQQVFIDARFTLDQIAEAVRNGTIDYEEYFNQIVLSRKVNGNSAAGEYRNNYGDNHGAYNARFYNRGEDEELGKQCNDGTKWTPGRECVILTRTVDKNTGVNPFIRAATFLSGEPDLSTSVCSGTDDSLLGAVDGVGRCRNPNNMNPVDGENEFAELYLINEDGDEKTIFVREAIAEGSENMYSVSFVKMKGLDVNGDLIPDEFTCDAEAGFNCTLSGVACGASLDTIECPDGDDKDVANAVAGEGLVQFSSDFIPISPNRINIKQLNFKFTPLEDPFKSFAEDSLEFKKLPHVTITMTVEPNYELPAVGRATTERFELTLQETVTTRLLNAVPAPILGEFD